MSANAIARWHEIVATGDVGGLDSLLADDVVFYSPVVHRPQVGKVLAGAYLRAAVGVLGKADFRYVEEWPSANSAVLEFEATIDSVVINGIDIIHFDADQRIVRFKVMVRPLKGMETLRQMMAQALEAAAR
jgi:hypothetical protein